MVHVRANVSELRESADTAIRLSQQKSLERHSSKVAAAKIFQEGDYVVVRHLDTTVGSNKKLKPKYRGPYVIDKVLPHDRYVIKDIENCLITQIPYTGIIESNRLKHWIKL